MGSRCLTMARLYCIFCDVDGNYDRSFEVQLFCLSDLPLPRVKQSICTSDLRSGIDLNEQ